MNFIENNLEIWMLVGTGNNQKFINIIKLYERFGPHLCSALRGYHAFMGSDFNSAFYRKQKKNVWNSSELSNYIQALSDISSIQNCNLDQLFATLVEYIFRLYAFTGVDDINAARVVTFTKAYCNNHDCNPLDIEKIIDGLLFPPCQVELQQHFLRTPYIAHRSSHAHLSIPTGFLSIQYGWEEHAYKYCFKWFVGDQLPPSITSITNLERSW